jgi:hypothetical protein
MMPFWGYTLITLLAVVVCIGAGAAGSGTKNLDYIALFHALHQECQSLWDRPFCVYIVGKNRAE